MKQCTKCKQEKSLLDGFYKNKSSKDLFSSICKICFNIKTKQYKANNKERIKEANKQLRLRTIEKRHQYDKEYALKNKEKIREYKRQYKANKCKTDLEFHLLCKLRTRLHHALVNQKALKANKTLELVGCSIKELKEHLEKQFKPNMSWDKRESFHIDHIKPVSSFNLLNEEEQRKCFHYSNLQPLYPIENLKKSNKTL